MKTCQLRNVVGHKAVGHQGARLQIQSRAFEAFREVFGGWCAKLVYLF